MKAPRRFPPVAAGVAAAAILSAGAVSLTASASAPASQAAAQAPVAGQIVGMRRLTEAQYRNSIADIFGPDIKVAGRFEPIVRPAHELIASGSRGASISPSGLEQFDAMARNIAAQVFGESRRAQFIACRPRDLAKPDPACAEAALAPLGRYLFRRPLPADELAAYVKVAGEAAGPTGSFYKGLELALAAMLISPRFLYIIETAAPDPQSPGALVLDDYSRAARLSYTLWNSTPNETLLRAAEAGKLQDPKQLSAIARSMVASPRFQQGVRAFFTDMLLFERFDELSKDPVIYPYFNSQGAQAMPEQMLRTIVDHLVTRKGDYRQLFTTNRTFMNRSLGALYQTPVRTSGWEPFEFGPEADRAGLLGQAGFLAMYSQSGRSSPTLRGRAIRELLMCQPVPNPPGNVNFTAVQETGNLAMPTARVRLTAHMADENCSSCHKLTDPAGLSLERFDGVGSFRTRENGALIDPVGELDGVPFSGAAGLGKVLAASPDTTLCVASRALEYARAVPSEDAGPVVERLSSEFAEDGYTIASLFLRVVTLPEAYQVKPPAQPAKTQVAAVGR
jgi:hypothetical protein